jgi:hypothetical protein
MGTVLEFKPLTVVAKPSANTGFASGEIVIFPGVRIERHELDLGHRLKNSAGGDDFCGLGPKRPRKSC